MESYYEFIKNILHVKYIKIAYSVVNQILDQGYISPVVTTTPV